VQHVLGTLPVFADTQANPEKLRGGHPVYVAECVAIFLAGTHEGLDQRGTGIFQGGFIMVQHNVMANDTCPDRQWLRAKQSKAAWWGKFCISFHCSRSARIFRCSRDVLSRG
jgi:hypothetical protein